MDNKLLIRLAENVVVVYVYTAITLLLADGADYLSVGFWKGAAIAAIPSALAVVKGFLASRVNSPDSPAFTE